MAIFDSFWQHWKRGAWTIFIMAGVFLTAAFMAAPLSWAVATGLGYFVHIYHADVLQEWLFWGQMAIFAPWVLSDKFQGLRA